MPIEQNDGVFGNFCSPGPLHEIMPEYRLHKTTDYMCAL